jgi:hypothetical protein
MNAVLQLSPGWADPEHLAAEVDLELFAEKSA